MSIGKIVQCQEQMAGIFIPNWKKWHAKTSWTCGMVRNHQHLSTFRVPSCLEILNFCSSWLPLWLPYSLGLKGYRFQFLWNFWLHVRISRKPTQDMAYCMNRAPKIACSHLKNHFWGQSSFTARKPTIQQWRAMQNQDTGSLN